MPEELKLYNPHDGLTGRDGGPYLDQVEAVEAEKRRAVVEKREPDLDNPPATAGIPLVTASELVKIANPASNPSQSENNVIAQAVDKIAADDDFAIESVASVPSGSITGFPQAEVNNAGEDPTNPTSGASFPAQMPNADVTETTEADDVKTDEATTSDSVLPTPAQVESTPDAVGK